MTHPDSPSGREEHPRPRLTRLLVAVVLPLAIIAVGVVVAAGMILSRPEVTQQPPRTPPPLVRAQEVTRQDVVLHVTAQGTVLPRSQSSLVAEVPGRVVEVSPQLVNGGYFRDGDELLRIDPTDYEQAVATARAEVARARVRLEQERVNAEIARVEWERLGEGEGTPLALRELQVAEAEAVLGAAEAALERAKRDLERTVVRAPFQGRVRSESVDVGQYLPRGGVIAQVYAVDYAEVRLPIADDDLAFLDLPLHYRGEERDRGPRVTLRADFAGTTHQWEGRIVRTEGEIDPRTRMIYLVARVKDPYGRAGERQRPPLAVGMFVEAEIEGLAATDVAVIPRAAVRDGNKTLVIDEENRLRFREIEILREERERAIVREGLASGELVCISPLDTVVDGMSVRTQVESAPEGTDR